MKKFLNSCLTVVSNPYRTFQHLFSGKSILHLRQANYSISPLIMIPGSSARENRFNRLVRKLNRKMDHQHSLIRIRAWDNGRITFKGKMRRRDRQPIFVVAFENNRDGYQNIKKQALLFDKVLDRLQLHYQFEEFNGIGHSNGGLVYTEFLEHYFSKYSHLHFKKLMTIGTPYNLNRKSRERQTKMLLDFIENKDKLPSDLVVYSLIGSYSKESDGIVHQESAQAGQLIYQDSVQSYSEITITGQMAHHSLLPQNKQVIDLICQHFFDD